jgi:hypothetical protein
VWRTSHKPPDLPPDIGALDRRFSVAAHHLLYALMVLIPAFGFVAYVWHGRAFDYGFVRLDFGVASNRDVVEQETQGPQKNNERGNGPVEGDGGRVIARGRRGEAPLGRENIHAIALSLVGGAVSRRRRLVHSPQGFLWAA